MRIVCLDLDGTVSDGRARLHYIKNPPKDWHNFFMESMDDPTYTEIVNMVIDDKNNGDIIIVTTARPVTYYDVSKDWLDKHNIPYDEILMRPLNDYRPDYEIKKDMIEKITIKYGALPYKAYDDKEDVINMFIENGIPVVDAKLFNEME